MGLLHQVGYCYGHGRVIDVNFTRSTGNRNSRLAVSINNHCLAGNFISIGLFVERITLCVYLSHGVGSIRNSLNRQASDFCQLSMSLILRIGNVGYILLCCDGPLCFGSAGHILINQVSIRSQILASSVCYQEVEAASCIGVVSLLGDGQSAQIQFLVLNAGQCALIRHIRIADFNGNRFRIGYLVIRVRILSIVFRSVFIRLINLIGTKRNLNHMHLSVCKNFSYGCAAGICTIFLRNLNRISFRILNNVVKLSSVAHGLSIGILHRLSNLQITTLTLVLQRIGKGNYRNGIAIITYLYRKYI